MLVAFGAATPALAAPPAAPPGAGPANANRAAARQPAAPESPAVADFLAAHTAIADRYPAFELKGIDWDAVRDELRPAAEAAGDDIEALGRVMQRLVARLEDSHAVLLPGTRPVPTDPPRVFGPGMHCLVDGDDRIVVYNLIPGGAAEAEGIRVGDLITQIDGKPAADALAAHMELLRETRGFSSDRICRYRAVRDLFLAPEPGIGRSVRVERPGTPPRDVELFAMMHEHVPPRQPFPVEDLDGFSSVAATMLPDGIGYIAVRRIDPSLEQGLETAVQLVQDARAVVIDVRGNTGGGFETSTAFLNFLRGLPAPGAAAVPPGAAAPPEGVAPPGPVVERTPYDGPLAIFIDAGTISAGEGWSSWFMATGRARFYGERTAGASARKEEVPIAGGKWLIRLPVKLYTGFLDRPIERTGLIPDVELRPTADDLRSGEDPLLEALRRDLSESAG